MRIKKIYETIINMSAQELYMDIDQLILEKLKKNFEGKCRENSLIVQVEKIIKRSNCIMAKSRLDGSGDVNVQYQAIAITYHPGDILANCEILRIEKNHQIICKYDEYAVILVKGMRMLQSLKPQQKIGILVKEVSYLKERDKITIYGVPYTYPREYTFYGIVEDFNPAALSREDHEILRLKLDAIREELIAYDKTNTVIRQKIVSIYYPFKAVQTTWPTALQLMPITGELPIIAKNTWICRHPRLPKEEPQFLQTTAPMTQSELMTLLEGPAALHTGCTLVYECGTRALLACLDDYYRYLVFIRETAETFNTEALLNSHNNIWLIYQHIKT